MKETGKPFFDMQVFGINRSLGFSCLFLLKFAEVLFSWKNAYRHETKTLNIRI